MTRLYNFHIHIAFGALFLVVSGCSDPVQSQPPKTPPFECPRQPGSRWLYKLSRSTEVVVLSSVERKNNQTVMQFEFEEADGKRTPKETLYFSDSGLFRSAIADGNLERPRCILKLPHRDGQRWHWKDSKDDMTGEGVYEATGPSEVKVEAGVYQAIKVVEKFRLRASTKGELQVQADSGELTHTRWYASGVGLIKDVMGEVAIELVSFTPGR